MLTDLEIARSIQMRPISRVAADLGLREEEVEPGRHKARSAWKPCSAWPANPAANTWWCRHHRRWANKTVTSLGLGRGLAAIGSRWSRHPPALAGPTFGVKAARLSMRSGADGGLQPPPDRRHPRGERLTCWRRLDARLLHSRASAMPPGQTSCAGSTSTPTASPGPGVGHQRPRPAQDPGGPGHRGGRPAARPASISAPPPRSWPSWPWPPTSGLRVRLGRIVVT